MGAFCSVREMRSRMTTIATTTAIPIPIARQLVSRSSTVGFGWMNPPMQGLYYSLRLHHRDTEAQRDSILFFLRLVIPSAARNLLSTAACRKRFLTGLGMTNQDRRPCFSTVDLGCPETLFGFLVRLGITNQLLARHFHFDCRNSRARFWNMSLMFLRAAASKRRPATEASMPPSFTSPEY